MKKNSLVLILIIALSILPLYSYYHNYDKQQWKEAAEYLKNSRSNNEIMVVNAASNLLPLRYYLKNVDNINGVKDVDELHPLIKDEKTVWLLYASEIFSDPDLLIKKYLDANYKLKDKKEFVGIKIYKYAKK